MLIFNYSVKIRTTYDALSTLKSNRNHTLRPIGVLQQRCYIKQHIHKAISQNTDARNIRIGE